MESKDYIIGIDLGTSNCAMAFADPSRGEGAPVEDFPVHQLRRPGEAAPQPLLPSCLYRPAEAELSPDALSLPWENPSKWIVGEFARWQGARVPGRLVASSKSWLCHPGVDRSAAILPWGAPDDVAKISPVEAASLLLSHMAGAWNTAHPDAPFTRQEVVITVPASFDEVARALTVNAARKAGLEKFTLVEEPQAAFYDFTSRHRKDLARQLRDVRLVLVVDVGGGTSDFTLVQAGVSPEGPALRRIAVGDHLMLGGDNMDAALARAVEERMVTGGRKLSATQWTQLVQACRQAKESLLGDASPEAHHLSIVGEGSRLIGGSLSARISREEAARIVLDGFLPRCSPEETPRRASRTGIQELGLPYAQDAAITRHLAAFLRRHSEAGFMALGQPGEDSPGTKENSHSALLPRPDAILLNGGVFNSPSLSARLVEAVSAWWPGAPPIPLLRHGSLELAVARGAAYYGLVRRGLGRRIGGGAAHAFYVGLADRDEKVSRALCLIPRGHEEGETVELKDRTFHLTLGKPVQFPLFSTTADRVDRPGAVVDVGEELHPLPPIHTLLKGAEGRAGSVPVHLRATLTEIGTLELSCVSDEGDERWRLEFELRGAPSEAGVTVTESMPARFSEARLWVEHIYGSKPADLRNLSPGATPPRDVKQLWSSLERTLGPRAEWSLPVLRELWSVLHAGAGRRRRAADVERIYFQLAGYCLRPGFGYPLDAWRCEQTFSLFAQGVQHQKEKPVWLEFWVMWRRVSGGLDEARQRELWEWLKPHLNHRLNPAVPKHAAKPKGVQPEGLDEMVRTAASLEHLAPEEKTELGSWIVARIQDPATTSGGPWAWSIGRLGTRVPLYGSVHKTVPTEQAARWLSLLLEQDIKKVDGAPFAVAQLARLTGDRSRDLEEGDRERALEALRAAGAPEAWQRMVSEVVVMEAADEARALGDTLPVGLRLA